MKVLIINGSPRPQGNTKIALDEMVKIFDQEGIESINQNKEYMTFRDFASPDDIYYSSHFSKVNQDVKMTSFADHNLLYGEFKFK